MLLGAVHARPEAIADATVPNMRVSVSDKAALETNAPAEKAATSRASDASPVVNKRGLGASNKEARAREAEEDKALVVRAQSGDQSAFRELVERHQHRAFSIALGLVRNESDARDLVQDAFVRVYKSLSRFEGSSSFFTWFYRIITNLSIDFKRRSGNVVHEFDEARLNQTTAEFFDFPFLSLLPGADPFEVVRRTEIAERLQQALEALPPYHQGVIVMREVEGLSYEQMAQVMGVSKGTIMSRLYHARQKLQRVLIDCYQEQVVGASSADADPTGDA